MEYISKSEKETADIAAEIIKKYPGTHIFGLQGDLGSGKTVFVRGVAKTFGIEKNITSPTFVIMKNYPVDGKIITHIDAYRLNSKEDLEGIGFNEMVADPNQLIFIEWPERIFDKFPPEMKLINFQYVDEKTRKITIE